MKKFLMAMYVSMALVMMIAPAYAMEVWETHLPGGAEGLAAGYLPPPGFYFIFEEYDATNYHVYDGAGHAIPNFRATALVEEPTLLWSTGLKFLGADYGVAIAQPVDFVSLRFGTNSTVPGLGGAGLNGVVITGNEWGSFNTILVPFILSWKLPCDIHVKGALAVGLDDASSSPVDSLAAKQGYVSGLNKFMNPQGTALVDVAGIGSTIFVPSVGISWLYHGWNLSADLFYGISLKDTSLNYQSGDMFSGDYTLSYTTSSKWTFGWGATQTLQLQDDHFVSTPGGPYMDQPGTRMIKYMTGPLLGYNFGPCSIMAAMNRNVYVQNDMGGTWFFVRLVVPLGNPCPLGGK